MNLHKIVSHVERINSIEAEAALRRLTSPTPTVKPSVSESIASGRILEVVWEYLVPNLRYFAIATLIFFLFINAIFWRLTTILTRDNPAKKVGKGKRPPASAESPTHLCVVLGSGGHTAEMLTMLRDYPNLLNDYTHRTYIVSAGDSFSAIKATELEKELASSLSTDEPEPPKVPGEPSPPATFDIVTITRARRVHQSLLTTPITVLLCLRDCLKVLRGLHKDQHHALSATTSPDLILTNGPGTGVCVVIASIILLFFGAGGTTRSEETAYHNCGQMRTVYIESWARVKTLSLSGEILKPLVDRFVVQWEPLQKKIGEKERGGRAEFVGVLAA